VPEHSYLAHGDWGTTPWNPHDRGDLPLPDCAYLGGVFRAFEERWTGPPLTFFVTYDTTALPRYGSDVVAVVLNDEWFRTPAYGGQVLAVLRNLSNSPWFPWETVAPPSVASAFALTNHLRILSERARAHRKMAESRRTQGWAPPRTDNIVDVPLGYYRQPEKPIKPFDQRDTDVYFGGSLIHDLDRKERWKQAVKRLAGNPKQLYRASMLHELERVRSAHPEVRAKVTVTGEFRDLQATQVTDYAEDMMDARVALVPRGTAAESYRLYEAWRYGCIVICEPLPPRPFLEGAPAIRLRSWRELEPALLELLDDPARQRELHGASLRWWQNVCSEEAIGSRLVVRLSDLRDGVSRKRL
jgi:hypothetical protein